MQKYAVTEIRSIFSEVINRVAYGKEKVILTRRGKPIVKIVPVENDFNSDLAESDFSDYLSNLQSYEKLLAKGKIKW